MAYRLKTVRVTRDIDVRVDAAKFDEAFMAEFRASFYGLHTVDDHIEHLARLYAQGIVDEHSTFIEGYGDPKAMGIEFVADSGCESDFV